MNETFETSLAAAHRFIDENEPHPGSCRLS